MPVLHVVGCIQLGIFCRNETAYHVDERVGRGDLNFILYLLTL